MTAGKRPALIIALCLMLLALTACTAPEMVDLPVLEDYALESTDDNRRHLRVGVVPGPYGDMFMDTIAPGLKEKGYEIEIVTYKTHDEPNRALDKGEIDLNLFQSYEYLNNFKLSHSLAISAVCAVPTAGMGLFSEKYETVLDIEPGATVVVPSDRTGLARALSFLDSRGVITLDFLDDRSKATVTDILKNPHELEFIFSDASFISQSLKYRDLAVINGNYALDAGMSLSDAIFEESLSENNKNVIAVRTEDLGSTFVDDIMDVVYSDEYRDMITDPWGKYTGFQLPGRFSDYHQQGGAQ